MAANSEDLDLSSLPSCKVLLRSKQGVEVYELNGERPEEFKVAATRPFLCKGATSIPLATSPDGEHVYIHMTGKGIVRCPIPDDTTNVEPIDPTTPAFFTDSKGVQMMDLSPKGSYLLTWERWYEEACPNNLKVWETATGKLLAAFPQRNIKRDVWPYLQWTHDERIAALVTTSEVRFYPAAILLNGTEDPTAVRYSDKLRISSVASISVPRSCGTEAGVTTPYLLTAFVPGTKDKPARACLYRFLSDGKTKPDTPPLLSKSLFQAEDMKVHWSPAGDAALLTLQTSVDSSGESYYGSSQLFMLRYGESDVVAVPLPQEGAVSDVAWLPDPAKPPCFVVIAGKMPSLASLHHGKTGKASFVFGNAHRNVVSWSPHGRFLCLAGFGNLAGGMSFWDRNKQKLINNGCVENANGSLRAASAVVGYDWAPSSRWFLCSTCSPRMNVDNGVRLFRYNGQAVTTPLPWSNENYLPDKLLQACFVPAKPLVYPDRSQSPPPEGFSEAGASAATPAAAAAAPKPASRYVPPSARNRGGGTSLAERMRREKEGNLQTAARVVDTKVKTPTGAASVVGMTAQPQKSKAALKREKEKKKKQQQEEQERLKKEEEAAAAAAASAPSTADPEKRARKIMKTLKQIDDLKQKDASDLNEDQKAKVASEAELRAELAKLGL
uniref:Eukaryotic translation initiation factor 2A n=1 Tax=Entomoneis paludosa TaxID=265537 RepID=A0A7S2YDS5_9STRA|mmetsp:Transcript_28217/g.59037  ORF Transcript_28217/g.59037 Transcript_28217/m.59037 type:complete len:667 (+) Transcript_28217:100-2100(+)|eukprot:CAMPEP_0172461804 /NCGR_PEP_ID=MMETSP1065-20121228/41784_1 /TAXON_ID=265537 /ORGANISM="Amphiprora paludosa, Strain CCMP125" /LENGTH=666 /DNA_ID=CAMNT_0013217257 /DNA_START=45 /DNA_END=2045 /DNA_ORIENTATION=+